MKIHNFFPENPPKTPYFDAVPVDEDDADHMAYLESRVSRSQPGSHHSSFSGKLWSNQMGTVFFEDVVLDSFNNASRDKEKILDQIY